MTTTAETHNIKGQRDTRTPGVTAVECTCGADLYIHATNPDLRIDRIARRHSAHRCAVAAKNSQTTR